MKTALYLVLIAAAQAHELGTTRITATFKDGSYDIAIETDASALLEKLQAASGSAATDVRAFEPEFRHRVHVEFDGVEVSPAISFSDVIHLTGPVPAGARQLTWAFGWSFATYALTVQNSTQWIEGPDRSAPVTLGASHATSASALRYLRLGFTHILPNGLDHMLFVLGIYFLNRRLRPVLLQVSAFTVAHSLTLALSLYGLVKVSPAVVEPLIALSIAYVAIENLFLSELKPWRLALVFSFGLLHGLGFAGALAELDLPRSEYAWALVSFNLGVEAAQLAVVAGALALFGWYCARRDWYRARIAVPASGLIACTAVYWCVQRLS